MALGFAPVSLVAPVREFSIVIAGVIAGKILGEASPARRLLGSGVIVAGIIPIAVS